MAEATCARCGAVKKVVARGLCNACYQRAKAGGFLHEFAKSSRSYSEALAEAQANVTMDGCWPWPLVQTATGYPYPTPSNGRSTKAYVAVYEALVGPVPDGMTLDHLCHSNSAECAGGPSCLHRRCVNPEHLEPATRGEQSRRRAGYRAGVCVNGHAWTDENTYWHARSDGYTVRCCRACKREYAAIYYTQRKRRSA